MKKADAVVIGAGPGGYVAAIRLAQLGKKAIVVERAKLGGVCLNWGCIPSKALIYASSFFENVQKASAMGIDVSGAKVNIKKMQEWKQTVVDRLTGGVGTLLKGNKIEVVHGEAKFTSKNEIEVSDNGKKEKIQFDSLILATGSRPIQVPGFEFDGKQVISSKEALELSEIPKEFVVIGGGIIGVEIGTVYAKLGSKVTIVEMMDQILPGNDPDLVKIVARGLKKRKVDVHLKAKAKSLEKKKNKMNVVVEDSNGKELKISADRVLVAVGCRPNIESLNADKIGIKTDKKGFVEVNDRLETSVNGVYAIGDLIGGPLLAHKASKEGMLAAEAIAGQKISRSDVRAMPAAIFCDPEIATVGLSEKEAKEEGYEVKVGSFPFAANGRALSTNHPEGVVKVVADKKDDRVLGVHICGPDASDLISEAALAIEMGATTEDVALTVHPHPTLSEGVMEGMEAAAGHAIHVLTQGISHKKEAAAGK